MGIFHKPRPDLTRFVVGIDVPVCAHSCEGPHYYNDAYFNQLTGTEPTATRILGNTSLHAVIITTGPEEEKVV